MKPKKPRIIARLTIVNDGRSKSWGELTAKWRIEMVGPFTFNMALGLPNAMPPGDVVYSKRR